MGWVCLCCSEMVKYSCADNFVNTPTRPCLSYGQYRPGCYYRVNGSSHYACFIKARIADDDHISSPASGCASARQSAASAALLHFFVLRKKDAPPAGGNTRTTQHRESSESRMDKIKKRWAGYFVGLLVVLAAAAWWLLRRRDSRRGLPAATAESKPPKLILPVKSPGVSTPFWSKRVSSCTRRGAGENGYPGTERAAS